MEAWITGERRDTRILREDTRGRPSIGKLESALSLSEFREILEASGGEEKLTALFLRKRGK